LNTAAVKIYKKILQGKARQGTARLGEAWRGKARQGKARRGAARYGRTEQAGERIRMLRPYVVDRWTVLLPQQELGVVESQNGGGWVDWDVMACTKAYALMLALSGFAKFLV
jgi:hypothetical protein